MNISKIFLMILGGFCMVAGVVLLVGMRSIGWNILLPLILVAVGFALFTGRGISI